MKKSILIFATLMMTAISFSFANKTDGISGNITSSFKKDFANASEVSWEKGRMFTKATFKMNDHVTFAYYSPDGELVAVTRNILSTQLPINQLLSLNSTYKDYWITELFEVNSNNETTYYIGLENSDTKMVLQSTESGDWKTYSKEVKR